MVSTNKKIIHTDQAPQAIGNYSQAIQAGDTVYISGQIPLCPQTMQLIEGSFAEQAHQMFKNLRAVVQAAGAEMSDVIKVTLYLTEMNNFAVANEVMACYFSQPYPARSAIGVAQLPKGASVEVDAILKVAV